MKTSRISNQSNQPDLGTNKSADLHHLRQELKKSQKSGDKEKTGWSLVHIAGVLKDRRLLSSAVRILEQAKAEFTSLGNQFALACTLHELSVINRELGRNTLALDLAYRATRLFEDSKKTLELGWSYENLSTIHFNLFHRPEIMTYAQKARTIFMDFNSKRGLGWNSCHLGGLYFDNGLYSRSEQHYKEALTLFSKLRDKEGLSSTYLGLAMVFAHQLQLKSALDSIKKAKKLFVELEAKDGLGWSLLHESAIKYKLGKLDESFLLAQKGMKIFSPLRHQIGVASSLYQLGKIYRDRGQFVKAWQSVKESLHLHTDMANKKGMGWSANELGKIYLDLNDSDHAKKYFLRAKQLAVEWDNGALKAEAQKNLSRIDRESGLIQKAMDDLKKTQEISNSLGTFETDIEIKMELVRCLLLVGDYRSAQSVLWEADALKDKYKLNFLNSSIQNLWGEINLVLGKKQEALLYFKKGLEAATKMRLGRDHVEALMGLIQIDWTISLLRKIEKEIRRLGCRKLKAKYLLLKGQMLWGRQGVIDIRVLNQSFNVIRSSQLLLLERQALLGLSRFYRDAKALKEKEIVDEQSKALLQKGPVDLYLIQPPPAPAPSFLISLAS